MLMQLVSLTPTQSGRLDGLSHTSTPKTSSVFDWLSGARALGHCPLLLGGLLLALPLGLLQLSPPKLLLIGTTEMAKRALLTHP